MTIIADEIAKLVPVNRENIFVHTHYAKNGHVLDNNQIVKW